MKLKSLLLTLKGRIGRKDYWIGTLIVLAANTIVPFVPFVGQIWTFVFIYCSICVAGKRLHDIGLSAWIAGIFVPIMTAIHVTILVILLFAVLAGGLQIAFIEAEDGGNALAITLIIWTILQLGFTIWLGTKPSDPKGNRFGPPPLPLDATGL